MKRRLRAACVFLCQRILLLGDGVLQSLAGLEEGGLLFRNGDGLEGLGVDALASLALLDAEGAESNECDLVVLLHGFLDGIHERIDHDLGFLLGHLRHVSNSGYKFSLVHAISFLVFYRAFPRDWEGTHVV